MSFAAQPCLSDPLTLGASGTTDAYQPAAEASQTRRQAAVVMLYVDSDESQKIRRMLRVGLSPRPDGGYTCVPPSDSPKHGRDSDLALDLMAYPAAFGRKVSTAAIPRLT